jgi:rhamnogalacturonan endolyase
MRVRPSSLGRVVRHPRRRPLGAVGMVALTTLLAAAGLAASATRHTDLAAASSAGIAPDAGPTVSFPTFTTSPTTPPPTTPPTTPPPTTTPPTTSPPPTTPPPNPGSPRQMERLGRGVISVGTAGGNLVSWRWLGTDPTNVGFNVFRAGRKLTATPITTSTNFLDAGAPAGSVYTVAAVVNGIQQPASAPSLSFANGFLDVPIQAPAPSALGATYSANDASVGDLDGDGQYEIVLKWDPSDSKDNSIAGATSPVFVDAYKLDGTRMWRIGLGPNIRAGAHYTQFQVYDYDGDGKAEVAMKTADGTVDGVGAVIGDPTARFANANGYVLAGPEFLTMFDGRTGAALSTVPYVPPRGVVSSWGDSNGNRVDRFLAATAYLDGVHPSLIESRGYYTRTVISAWDFSGGQLRQRWTFDSNVSGSQFTDQGNHSMSIADVDRDGKDEIIFGAMAIDDTGVPLWNTRNGHGDALHVGDLDPSRPGLEIFKVDENSTAVSSWFADAATGQVLWSTPPNGDNGRGVADDVWAGNPGAEMWSARGGNNAVDVRGVSIGRKPASQNFTLWWDADPVRELLDQTHIDKYGPSADTRLLTGAGVHSNNGTKATPTLSADLFGDWREEVVWPTTDNTALRIYSTPTPTTRRITTLMHDPMYRVAVAWQNTGYNQPPHPSFFIGDRMPTPPRPNIFVVGSGPAPTGFVLEPERVRPE